MILVLLVVPALVAVQHDVARQVQAMRRGLGSPSASVRWGFAILWATVFGWFGTTMGYTIATGALPKALTDMMPRLAGGDALLMAFGLFAAGIVILGMLAYVLAALTFQLMRRRAV